MGESCEIDTPPTRNSCSGALLVGAVVLLALYAIATPIGCPDLFWHIVIGEHVIDRHEIPTSALFAALPPDTPFRVNDWLGGTLLAAAFRAGSYAGVAALKIALNLAIALAIAAGALRAGAGAVGSAAVVALVYAGAMFRASVERPYLLGYVLLVVFVGILVTTEATRPRGILALFVVQTVWTASHGSSMLGPLLAVCVLAGSILKRISGGRLAVLSLPPSPSIGGAAALVAAAIAGLSTGPLGPSVLSTYVSNEMPVWEAMRLQTATPEWAPPTAEMLFVTLPLAGMSVAVVLLGLTASWLAQGRRVPVAEVLMVAGLVLTASQAIRFLPEMLFGCAIPLASAISAVRARFGAKIADAASALALASGIAGFVFGTMDGQERPAFRARRAWYPAAAVRALTHFPEGIVCNSFEFGGYLLYHHAPRVRPVIDGRIVSAYSVEHMERAADALASPAALSALTEEYDLVGCVIAYPDPAAARVFDRATWALVQIDDVSATFVRRAKVDGEWLAARELVSIDPADPFVSLRAAVTSTIAARAIAADLDRAEALTEDRFLLTVLRARVLALMGDDRGAAELRARALERFPGPESLRFATARAEAFLGIE